MRITPQQLNDYRVIPRVLVSFYGYACYEIYKWFISLPQPTAEQAAFATAIWGAAAVWFGFYVNSGKTKDE